MIDWQSDRAQRLDDPLLAYLADHECTEAEFYARLRKDVDALPPPSRALQFRFYIGDAAWRVRRLFKP